MRRGKPTISFPQNVALAGNEAPEVVFMPSGHPNLTVAGSSGNGVTSAPGALDYENPSTFGRISSTRDLQNDPREIQFALKFYW